MRISYQDSTISLVVRFVDGAGDPVDPISGPSVSIFPIDFNPEDPLVTDSDALVLNATESSLGDGLQVGTHLLEHTDTGIYRYQYDVTQDQEAGTYYDRWVAELNSGEADVSVTFEFEVREKVLIESYQLADNMKVTVTLDDSIADTDGNTLEDDYEWSFYTPFTPFYSSANLVDLELGGYLSGVESFAIELAILEASIEAEAQTFGTKVNSDWFEYVRKQYVTCRAGWFLVRNLNASPVKSKKLADLEVVWDNSLVRDALDKLADCVDAMKKILNTGGEISEYTSLKPRSGVKSGQFAARPNFGRTWGDKGKGTNSREYAPGTTERVIGSWSVDPTKSKK